jgi:hypothetical protein
VQQDLLRHSNIRERSTFVPKRGRKKARSFTQNRRASRNCIRYRRPDTLSKVRSVCKLAALLLALSVFASPLMACLQPENTRTSEERECCRKMAGDCGEMPASHSCCKTTVRDADPYLSSSRVQISAPTQAAVAVLPVSETIGLQNLISQFVISSDAHAPPESPLVEISVLRI